TATNWDLKYGRVLGKSREAQDVNGKLDKIRLGIEECYSKTLKNEGTVNSAKLKNVFLGMESGELTFFKFYDRTHINIVSTCVSIDGKKIPDDYDHPRSMAICRDLETNYNLQKATEQEQKQSNKVFKPVDYHKGDIKSQIASVVRYLPKNYSFSTMGSYNALLSLFNITAEEVKGERNGQP